MAYAYVAGGSFGTVSSGSSVGVSATLTTGEGVVVAVLMHVNGTAITSVTDTLSNTYSLVGSALTEPGAETYAIYYAKNVTGGSTTITASFSGTANYSGIAYDRYTGLSASAAGQSGAGQSQSSTTSTDAITSGNMSPTDQPALLYAFTVDGDGGSLTISAGTGFTSRGAFSNWDSAIGFKSCREDKRITSTSAVAGTFTTTASSHRYNTIVAAFTEAAAAASASPALTHQRRVVIFV